MTDAREKQFLLSKEFRQRTLQLSFNNRSSVPGKKNHHGNSEEGTTHSDESDQEDQQVDSTPFKTDGANDAVDDYFSFGNITVIDWGKIIPTPSFHTKSQIYPLGFKCLRYEIDTALDSIVELFCEIDACYTINGTTKLYSHRKKEVAGRRRKPNRDASARKKRRVSSGQDTEDGAANDFESDVEEDDENFEEEKESTPLDEDDKFLASLTPLFRITAKWYNTLDPMLPKQLKVYEGRTTQQVWQAAMLETYGLPDANRLSLGHEDSDDDMDGINGITTDEEEERLRSTIRDQRRSYFRVLRQAQSQGVKKAVRPRMNLETMEHFVEETMQRCIEGMSNIVIQCEQYIFLSERYLPREEIFQKDLIRMEMKLKALEKQSRKLDHIEHHIRMILLKQQRQEEHELRKRMEQEAKELRSIIQQYGKARLHRCRDIEKSLITLKGNKMKLCRKKRDEIRSIVELFVEKQLINNKRFESQYNRCLQHGKGSNTTTITTTVDRPLPTLGLNSLWGKRVDRNFIDCLQLWQYLYLCHVTCNGGSTLTTRVGITMNTMSTPMTSCSIRDLCFEDIQQAFQAFHPTRQDLLHGDNAHSGLSKLYKAKEGNSLFILNLIGRDILLPCRKQIDSLYRMDISANTTSSTTTTDNTSSSSNTANTYSNSNNTTNGGLLPLNTITWRELAKLILTVEYLKKLGYTDNEVGYWMKGKGYVGIDINDRRMIKLAKYRIENFCKLSNEIQESILPFQCSGFGISIPMPLGSYASTASMTAVSSVSTGTAGTAGTAITSLKEYKEMLLAVYEQVKDCDEKHWWAVYDVVEAVAVRYRNRLAAGTSGDDAIGITEKYKLLSTLSEYRGDKQTVISTLEMLLDKKPTLSLPLGNGTESNTVTTTGSAAGDEPMMIEDESDGMNQSSVNDEKVKVKAIDSPSKRLKSSTTGMITPSKLTTNLAEELHCDKKTLLLRCYNIVTYILNHPNMNALGDIGISDLQELQQALEDQEINGIYEFYQLILKIFANILIRNLEGLSQYYLIINKLYLLFERLFLEMVLCCDSPLPSPYGCCVFCRGTCIPCGTTTTTTGADASGTLVSATSATSLVDISSPSATSTGIDVSPSDNSPSTLPIPITGSNVNNVMINYLTCERCEGMFHITCLDTPPILPLKGDWYCPFCIEQRGVACAHPYRTVRVLHTNHVNIGEVVGIEQSHGKVWFIIDFNVFREKWDSNKLYKHIHVEQCDDLILPNDIDLDDYDKACALARGYHGWGLSETELVNIFYDSYDALKLLGQNTIFTESNCLNNSNEWLLIFKTFLYNNFGDDRGFMLLQQQLQIQSTQLQQWQEQQQQSKATIESESKEGKDMKSIRSLTPCMIDNANDNSQTNGVMMINSGESVSSSAEDGDGVELPNTTTTTRDSNNTTSNSNNINSDDIDEFTNNFAGLKGSEDALLVYEILNEHLEQYINDIPDEPIEIRRELGDYASTVYNAAMNALSKPADTSLDLEQWSNAFHDKLHAITTNHDNNTTNGEEVVTCYICHCSEHDFCNPLINIPKQYLSFIIPTITDEDLESATISNSNRYKIHHSCKNVLSHYKQIAMIRQEREDNIVITELLSSINTLNCTGLGRDRYGDNYWLFNDCHSLLICRDTTPIGVVDTTTPTTTGLEVEGDSNSVISSSPTIDSDDNHDSDDDDSNKQWILYRDIKDIQRVYQWLNDKHSNEKKIKRVIQQWLDIHYPTTSSSTISSSSASLPATAIDTTSTITMTAKTKKQGILPIPSAQGGPTAIATMTSSTIIKKVRDLLWSFAFQSRKTSTPFSNNNEVYFISETESLLRIWQGTIIDVRRLGRSRDNSGKDSGKDCGRDSGKDSGKDCNTNNNTYMEREKETRPYSYRIVTEYSTSSSDGIWILDSQVFPKSSPLTDEIFSLREVSEYKHTMFDSLPNDILLTLNASKYIHTNHRIIGFIPLLRCKPSTYHSCESIELLLLKDCMLYVLSALPIGCLDEHDDKWGNNFIINWKNAISSSNDANMLMNCQILLEYGIKNAWLKPSGLKIFSCLPSRSHALRNATVGSVAIRLWMLDQCIRYEKVVDPKTVNDSNKGNTTGAKKKKH